VNGIVSVTYSFSMDVKPAKQESHSAKNAFWQIFALLSDHFIENALKLR
jgi:hypothetical protein